MTLYEFNQLSYAEQQLAMRDSVFLAHRREGGAVAYLFQIDAFYVEVRHGTGVPAEDRVRSFISTYPLEPYLEQMEIDL